jgi:hypothetical protein
MTVAAITIGAFAICVFFALYASRQARRVALMEEARGAREKTVTKTGNDTPESHTNVQRDASPVPPARIAEPAAIQLTEQPAPKEAPTDRSIARSGENKTNVASALEKAGGESVAPLADVQDDPRVRIEKGSSAVVLPAGSAADNLRVQAVGANGSEVQLTFNYTYDGGGGSVAQITPVIGKRGIKDISGWFGADPVRVSKGRGTIAMKVQYFYDEPGVPGAFISDQVRIMVLNEAGTALLAAVPFLKTIKWAAPGLSANESGPAAALERNALATNSVRTSKDVADSDATVSNIDIVSRSTDRSKLIVGVEFDMRKKAANTMGVQILREGPLDVGRYFTTAPQEIGRSRRNFLLFPVRFDPPSEFTEEALMTDSIVIYLTTPTTERNTIYRGPMSLRWLRAPKSRRE